MLIFGHRGNPHDAPENTVASFESAFNLPCDGVECDLRLSQDNEIVVVHDDSLLRTTGIDLKVATTHSQQITATPAFAALDSGERPSSTIPRLETVLERCPEGCTLNLEIKTDLAERLERLAQRLAQLIVNYPSVNLFVSSFDEIALRFVRQYSPNTPIAVAFESQVDFDHPLRASCWSYSLHYSLINEDVVNTAKALGLIITSWTVNSLIEAKRLQGLGIHSVISDKPRAMIESFRQP